MAGVSEAPFRQICRAAWGRRGAFRVPLVRGDPPPDPRTLEGAEFEECERPIGIQIYGADPEAMAEATALITEHYEPEFIDINFGCPVKKVVQRNGGSGCLRDMELVERIIRAVHRRHAPAGDGQDPERLERRVARSGRHRAPDAGRRRARLHAARPHPDPDVRWPGHWDEIARVVEALDIPVIGNGDIQTADDVVRMRQHTGCAGVMVGRGAFGNPWIFRDAQALLAGEASPPAPDAAERFRVALEHARLAIRLQGDSRKTVIEFRKHFGWYTKGLHGASDLRQRLFQVESMAEAEEIFASYLGPLAQVA